MAEFTPIETQEDLDRVISDRLKRAQEKYKDYLSPDQVAEKYKEYLSPEQVEEKYKGYLSPEDAAKKDAQIKKYETDSAKTRIARAAGLPEELADRLSGEDEDSLKKDAESLAKIFGSRGGRKTPPLKEEDGDGAEGTRRAAYKAMLSNLKGE